MRVGLLSSEFWHRLDVNFTISHYVLSCSNATNHRMHHGFTQLNSINCLLICIETMKKRIGFLWQARDVYLLIHGESIVQTTFIENEMKWNHIAFHIHFPTICILLSIRIDDFIERCNYMYRIVKSKKECVWVWKLQISKWIVPYFSHYFNILQRTDFQPKKFIQFAVWWNFEIGIIRRMVPTPAFKHHQIHHFSAFRVRNILLLVRMR